MAVINTTVAKSRDTKDAALNLNAKAFDIRRTVAAVWDLRSTTAIPPKPETTMSLNMSNGINESVVNPEDGRDRVKDIDFGPGGKYRSIVKLFVHYEFQGQGNWAMGTGWLIAPDIFVTAGHCSYDWSHAMGRAAEVKAYIGYKGRESESDPNVQFRHVTRIVTTEGWVTNKGQKSFDVSFMQVDKPFSGIKPLAFAETPKSGDMMLGVVGYPGDKKDETTQERGAYMYEMFKHTTFDLARQDDTMLEYQIDTFGGNSGSPVLTPRQSAFVSVGAHVYGGTYNSASVIGRYGNPYHDYLAAFGMKLPDKDMHLVPVTGNTTISAPTPAGFGGQIPPGMLTLDELPMDRPKGENRISNPRQKQDQDPRPTPRHRLPKQNGDPVQNGGQLTKAEEESFLDVMKKVASIGLPIAGQALNILGPVGALAGFALNAAGQFAAESTNAENSIDSQIKYEGSMERAIMAEAALSTIQSIQLDPELEESIFTDMKAIVIKALPIVRKTAPRILVVMMEPALRIALDSLHGYNQNRGAESFEDSAPQPFHPNVQYSDAIDQPVDHSTEAFLRNVQVGAEATIDGESEESFIDIIKAGIRFADKGLTTVVEHGLPLLVSALSSAESFGEEATSATAAPQTFSADVLAHRALVAEAALQAVMKLPPQQLQEEGFFDFISIAVKTIAPVAMKMAPAIASAINPTVGKLVQDVLCQESAMVGSENASTGRRRFAAPPKLIARKSLASLRLHHQNGGQDGQRYNQGATYNGYAQYGQGGYSRGY